MFRRLLALACGGIPVVELCLLFSLVFPAPVWAQADADPFAFFQPSVTTTAQERQQLDRDGTVARVLAADERELAVFSAVPVAIDGDRLIAWMRHIEVLKKTSYVEAIGRFSNPPRIEDLSSLTLDDSELEDLRRCRPGRCRLKLSSSEIGQVQQLLSGLGADWKPRLQHEFRRIVLQRVLAYSENGHAALPDYGDRDRPVPLQTAFSSLLLHSPFLRVNAPEFAEYLGRYPRLSMPRVESFIYWSKEQFGAKPVVSATQVNMLRGDGVTVPDALVAAKQIFATHYVDGSLSVTAIVGTGPGPRRYLVYLNRSDVDVLKGFWAGLVRRILERRLAAEAPGVLQALRKRLESEAPSPSQ